MSRARNIAAAKEFQVGAACAAEGKYGGTGFEVHRSPIGTYGVRFLVSRETNPGELPLRGLLVVSDASAQDQNNPMNAREILSWESSSSGDFINLGPQPTPFSMELLVYGLTFTASGRLQGSTASTLWLDHLEALWPVYALAQGGEEFYFPPRLTVNGLPNLDDVNAMGTDFALAVNYARFFSASQGIGDLAIDPECGGSETMHQPLHAAGQSLTA